jgi:hypothetical protein
LKGYIRKDTNCSFKKVGKGEVGMYFKGLDEGVRKGDKLGYARGKDHGFLNGSRSAVRVDLPPGREFAGAAQDGKAGMIFVGKGIGKDGLSRDGPYDRHEPLILHVENYYDYRGFFEGKGNSEESQSRNSLSPNS